MCLIAIAYRIHPDYPLLVAANRDEFYHRPTAPAHFWEDAPGLLAGRDLQAGGTWMGITRAGRFAAITNHRNPPGVPEEPRSRGLLTLDYLRGEMSPASYLHTVAAEARSYAGFNLLIADREQLYYFSNVEQQVRELPAGIYSLSNALLDSSWPKQQLARAALQGLLSTAVDHAKLHAVVGDHLPAEDHLLPSTGIDRAMERLLSAQFIASESYGTRATTTCWLDSQGGIDWCESSYLPQGVFEARRQLRFNRDGRE